ncbi:MAG: DNA alkylation repair protein [Saprospiraceae bacterium]|nr:DNA alkylation repair protein [Saprospiraceae bacterium]
MSDYISRLRNLLEQHSDEKTADWSYAYMKEQFAFFGIKAPLRNALFKQFFVENTPPQYSELSDLVWTLWLEPEREFQYFAIELLVKYKKQWTEDIIELFEKMIVHKSWWDSVDYISSSLISLYFKQFPHQIKPITEGWIDTGNMWLQRVCLIFQLSYRQKTDTELMFKYICLLNHSKEFFIQKAIGWALRQHARTDADSVKNFVENTSLAPISKREAMKHIS